MRDFNFFEPYLVKKNKLSKKQFTLYISISTIIIVLVIVPIVNLVIINKMAKQTAAVSSILDSEEKIEEREEIYIKQNKIKELKDYYNALESINSNIIEIDIINDLFLQVITDRVPEDVFFQNINIDADSIQISGIAKSNTAIALFEHNLQEFPYFENIFIPHISINSGGYAFTISFQIKGRVDYEAN